VLDINFGGVVNCCRSFGRRLVDRGTGGHIVNVASMAAYSPQQSMNAYSTSKAAVFMFGDCLRAELDQAGVGLTTVCPGVIDTNIVHTTRFDVPAGKQAKVEARRAQIEKAFAARRYGPEKVAKAIVSAVKKNKPIRPRHAGGGTSCMAPHTCCRRRCGARRAARCSSRWRRCPRGRRTSCESAPQCALAGVAPRTAGVVGRGRDVDVRPLHSVGDELAQICPCDQHAA